MRWHFELVPSELKGRRACDNLIGLPCTFLSKFSKSLWTFVGFHCNWQHILSQDCWEQLHLHHRLMMHTKGAKSMFLLFKGEKIQPFLSLRVALAWGDVCCVLLLLWSVHACRFSILCPFQVLQKLVAPIQCLALGMMHLHQRGVGVPFKIFQMHLEHWLRFSINLLSSLFEPNLHRFPLVILLVFCKISDYVQLVVVSILLAGIPLGGHSWHRQPHLCLPFCIQHQELMMHSYQCRISGL